MRRASETYLPANDANGPAACTILPLTIVSKDSVAPMLPAGTLK
jgi:hypothetical protein